MKGALGVLFAAVLQMSLTGGFVCLAVCALRLLLRRAPKAFSYGLWALVFLRFACPVAPGSAASVIPRWEALAQAAGQAVESLGAKAASEDKAAAGSVGAGTAKDGDFQDPRPEAWGEAGQGEAAGGLTREAWEAAAKADAARQGEAGLTKQARRPKESAAGSSGGWERAAANPFVWALWLTGVVALLLHQFYRSVCWRRFLGSVRETEEGVCEAEGLASPFVMGIWRPRVCIPRGLCGEAREFVLLHERTHIRRRDYLVKPLCFGIVCMHWFNPLAWLAWRQMCMDMEMSCDEAVLSRLRGCRRKAYAQTLMAFAGSQVSAGCLAFGEPYAKKRIRNVLRYKRPSYRLCTVLAALCLAASGCLLTNPTQKGAGGGQGDAGVPGERDAGTSAALPPGGTQPNDTAGSLGGTDALLTDINEIEAIPQELGSEESLGEAERKALLQAGLEADGPLLCIDAETLRRAFEEGSGQSFREEWLSEYFGGWYACGGRFYLEADEWEQRAPEPVRCMRAYVDADGLLHLCCAYETEDEPEAADRYGEAILIKESGRWRFLTNDVVWTRVEQPEDEAAQAAYEAAQKEWRASYEPGSVSPEVTDRFQSWEADLTHDGQAERLIFDWGYFDTGSWGIFAVLDTDGRVLYEADLGYAHVGWGNLYLCRLDGQDYLLQYSPTCYQGWCDYSYELFYLDAAGQKFVKDGESVSFYGSDGEPGAEIPAMDIPAMAAFAEAVNGYMEEGFLLVSTDREAIGAWPKDAGSELFLTSTSEKPVRLWETYLFVREDGERLGASERPSLAGLESELKAWCGERNRPYKE